MAVVSWRRPIFNQLILQQRREGFKGD